MSTANPNNPNHPFNLEFLIRTMLPQLTPQPGHDKPRESWDEDDRYDGRPKTDTIQVLFVKPNEAPELVTIKNELSAMQGLIGGTICAFESPIAGTVGLAHDEAVLLQMPPNRYIPTTKALIFGPLFIAGSGVNFHSLSEQELIDSLAAFTPPLTMEQIQKALRAHDEVLDWLDDESLIDRELDDALGE